MAKRKPMTRAAALAALSGVRFEMACLKHKSEHPTLGTLTTEEWYVVNDQAAADKVRDLTGAAQVLFHVTGSFRPMGQYPFDMLTVVLAPDGNVLNAYYGP
ncbi:hypothetical protein [Achromobacter anxifer]|uniref:hypothetical protein n=1 Tax=Achromobacter anxifer TaxID=1287737 RepID=UPI00159217B9|nr:hypothetical protein [Achromobacter anxifer]